MTDDVDWKKILKAYATHINTHRPLRVDLRPQWNHIKELSEEEYACLCDLAAEIVDTDYDRDSLRGFAAWLRDPEA